MLKGAQIIFEKLCLENLCSKLMGAPKIYSQIGKKDQQKLSLMWDISKELRKYYLL